MRRLERRTYTAHNVIHLHTTLKLAYADAMKTVGIIGGLSWESSAIYYRVMNRTTRAALGDSHSSRLILDSLDFNVLANAAGDEGLGNARAALVDSAKRLKRAGAEGLVIACNTAHRFADSVASATSLPLLHIGDAAGVALQGAGHQRVGVLGTLPTMQGAFLKQRLARFDIETLVPDITGQRAVHELITTELARGNGATACRPALDRVVADLKAAGAEAVLLACTELGLPYDAADAPVISSLLPLYDSAVLHARAAVTWALSQPT